MISLFSWRLVNRESVHQFPWKKSTLKKRKCILIEKEQSHTCGDGGEHLRISFWHLLMKPKKSEFWKNEKKLLEISSLYTCVPKTTIICHFGPFFVLYSPSVLPPNNSENQNFEKMKKTSRDVIILNLCNKKHNQMMLCLPRYGVQQT